MKNPITVELIKEKLATDQRWLEAAVLAIFRRQTGEEQRSRQTIEVNGRGFNGPDARCGTYMAKWLLGVHWEDGKKVRNTLDGKWLVKARTIMPKYAKQLLDEANIKAQQQVLVAV